MPFWSVFGHAVRNAVAHGLEPEPERVAAHKPPAGALRLSARRVGVRVTIGIADDGRGVNWDAVARKARAAGLPAETSDQLYAALFHDGLSTRDEGDDVAGRGIGMGALRAECEKLGGEMSLISAPGAGTVVGFSFPIAIVGQADEIGGWLKSIRPGPGSIASPRRPSSVDASRPAQ